MKRTTYKFATTRTRRASKAARNPLRIIPRRQPTNNPFGRAARVKPMLLLWALGIPLPIILLIYLLRGC